MEFDVGIFFSLKRLSIVEFVIVDLLERGFPRGREIQIVAIEPYIEILAVVLDPNLFGHPALGVAKGNIILDPHYLIIAVAFQIKHIVAVGKTSIMYDPFHAFGSRRQHLPNLCQVSRIEAGTTMGDGPPTGNGNPVEGLAVPTVRRQFPPAFRKQVMPGDPATDAGVVNGVIGVAAPILVRQHGHHAVIPADEM